MNARIFIIALCFCFIAGCSNTYSSKSLSSSQKETLVFVHGAHLTGSSWQAVSNTLKAVGFDTLLVNLPGRDLTDKPNNITLDVSSQALCNSMKTIHTPIVLIAHSQGGAVSNNALSICPKKNIRSIIYIAAVAPTDGDTPYSLLSKTDEFHYLKGIHYDENSGWMTINNPTLFADVFTNSQSSAIKNKVMASAVNEPAAIGEGVVHYDHEYFSTLDKFYIYTQFDKIISIPSQEKISRRIYIKKSAILATGHLPMISSPEILAQTIQSFLR